MRHVGVFAALALPLFGVSGVRGDVIRPSPNLPPQNSQYITPTQAHQLYNTGAGAFLVNNIHHRGFFPAIGTTPPQNVGGTGNDSFGSLLDGILVLPNLSSVPFTGNALVTVHLTKVAGPNGSSLGTYSTQMTQLDISGLPGGALIRVDPITPSNGQTTISDAGGGNFGISSFFDIFTDLSLDGGATWTPSTGSGHVQLVDTPEPSSLIVCSIGAVICLGTLRARRIGARRRSD